MAASGWFAARPSGTENIYKIYAESFQDQAHLDAIVAEARAIVEHALATGVTGHERPAGANMSSVSAGIPRFRPAAARDVAALAYGIGDVGPAAIAWIDRLHEAGPAWWQALPLGPTGYGNSPYQSLSSFAGNELLISPDGLIEDGLLQPGDCAGPALSTTAVDFAEGRPSSNGCSRQRGATSAPAPVRTCDPPSNNSATSTAGSMTTPCSAR